MYFRFIINSRGGIAMYEKMYHIMFRAAADAMDRLEAHQYQEAMTILEQASREAEEVYISG